MDDYYFTKDIGEASALLSAKAILTDIQWKDGLGFFYFKDKDKCNELSQQYYYGQLEVVARTIIDNFKMLKRKLYIVSGKEKKHVYR